MMSGVGSSEPGQDLSECETTILVAEAAVGSKAKSQQLTPHDMWTWNSQTHWKHWHGLWTMYHPLEVPHVLKSYKSVRFFWPVDKDSIHLYHRNQWYAFTGYEHQDMNWEFGPWAMYKYKHSLPNGILHPTSDNHRILQFQNGDLGWVQLALKPNDPKCVVFNELHFMACMYECMHVCMYVFMYVCMYDDDDDVIVVFISPKCKDASDRGVRFKRPTISCIDGRRNNGFRQNTRRFVERNSVEA